MYVSHSQPRVRGPPRGYCCNLVLFTRMMLLKNRRDDTLEHEVNGSKQALTHCVLSTSKVLHPSHDVTTTPGLYTPRQENALTHRAGSTTSMLTTTTHLGVHRRNTDDAVFLVPPNISVMIDVSWERSAADPLSLMDCSVAVLPSTAEECHYEKSCTSSPSTAWKHRPVRQLRLVTSSFREEGHLFSGRTTNDA